MATDIDSIALDVARRFTEEWDPQRRASLQVAIIQAIRAAHAQPVELAEQQGVGFTDAEIDSCLNALHRQMKASGQHNGGMVGVAWDRAVFRAALAAPGKQQGGEVQGDALAALEASMPYLETLHSIVGGEARASVWRSIERGRAALAARQPGGNAEQLDHALGQTIDQRDRYHEVADELADHLARITGVEIGEHSSLNCPWQNAIEAAESYQPAPGIDLGQLCEPIKEAVHTALSVHVSAMSQKKREQVAVYVARQLRDSQGDAAPGVDRG